LGVPLTQLRVFRSGARHRILDNLIAEIVDHSRDRENAAHAIIERSFRLLAGLLRTIEDAGLALGRLLHDSLLPSVDWQILRSCLGPDA